MSMPTSLVILHTGELDEEIVNEEDDPESIIQYFLEAYKNYLVQCIDYKDLLFYKYFCPAKRKEFREMARFHNGEYVTHEMIDTILSLKSVTDRFGALVQLFEEEFGNEKVLRILKGEKVPSNRLQNKERIQRVCMKDICENLHVNEIIPELRRRGLILPREGDGLRTKARTETNFDAAVDLLLILPSRHTNWYPRFIYCLIHTNHEVLAERVDKDLYQRINAMKGQEGMRADEEDGSVTSSQMIEDMSLVSGPMKTCTSYKELLAHNLTLKQDSEEQLSPPKNPLNNDDQKTHEEDIQETTFHHYPANPQRSPNEERVVKWVMESNSTGDDFDLERGSLERRFRKDYKSNKMLKRKLIPRRTGSLVTDSSSQTDHRARIFRHPTTLVSLSQIQGLTNGRMNRLSGPVPANTLQFNQWSGSGDWPSMASNFSSLEHLCVDNILDPNNIDIEMTCFHQRDSREEVASRTDDSSVNIKDENEDETVRGNVFKPEEDSERLEQIHNHSNVHSKDQERQFRFPALDQLFSIANLHPVKISMILKEHWDLTGACNLLALMSNRAMNEENDAFSLHLYYVATVIQNAGYAESIDIWIHKLLTGRESDGYFEFQDQLVRQVLDGFPHKQSSLLKKILAQLKTSCLGDGLTSLKIFIQWLGKGAYSVEEHELRSPGDDESECISSKPSQMPDSATIKPMCNNSSETDVPFKVKDCTGLKELGTHEREYQIIVEQIAKARTEEFSRYRIIRIQKILIRTLLQDYLKLKERMSSETRGVPNERLLFCSSKFVIEEWRDHIFQKDAYFTDNLILFKQNEHGVNTEGQNPNTNADCGCHRYLLLCRVCLGNSFPSTDSTCTYSVPNGYHSSKVLHSTKGTQYPIYRVSSANQFNYIS